MTFAPQQLVFDLPHRSATGQEDFLVSGSNLTAVELTDAAAEWPNGAALVVGPAGSGKSHLAHVWQEKTGAVIVAAGSSDEAALRRAAETGAVVVEDVDRGIADPAALFHLLNIARQRRAFVLVTSRKAAGELDIALPDLRSRVRALPVAMISAPDEALLNAVLIKLFADRQLHVEPGVVSYLMLRMERSMAAANAVVAEIDRLGLAMRRKVSKQLAQAALEAVAGRGD